jgi:flagellar basal-body rod protein FlgG
MRALSIAASGMQAQQLNVDVISHNIANMNTTAYKRQRAEFQDMLYQNLERPGSTSSASGAVLPLGIQIGVGVQRRCGGPHHRTRRHRRTQNPYDLAINGRGFFQSRPALRPNWLHARRQPRGERRWRDGHR